MPNTLLHKALLGLGGCALVFFILLGVLAALPPAVRAAVPHEVLGGAVLVLGAMTTRRFTRGPR
ncbi:hypothetical protein ACWDYJ_24115 [Streptomyces sp. NPDC003042]